MFVGKSVQFRLEYETGPRMSNERTSLITLAYWPHFSVTSSFRICLLEVTTYWFKEKNNNNETLLSAGKFSKDLSLN